MNALWWIVGGAVLLVVACSRMPWPVVGAITSPFRSADRPDHNGVDIRAAVGTPVRASDAGVVAAQYWHDRGGRSMLVDYANGMRAGFAHLGAYNVADGESFARGQVIAYTGDTGTTTGPHLHYTLRNREGEYVNPQHYHA